MALNNALSYLDSVITSSPSTVKCSKCILFPRPKSPFGGYQNGCYEIVKLADEERFSNLAINYDESFSNHKLYLLATGRRLTGSNPVAGAAMLAECLNWMELLPDDAIVVCLDARSIVDHIEKMPNEFVIAYDDLSKFPLAPIVPANDVSIGKRGKICWQGEVPANIRKSLVALRDEELRSNQMNRIATKTTEIFQLEDAHNGFLQSSYHAAIIKALVELSYGNLHEEELPRSLPANNIFENARWLAQNVIFDELRSPDFEDYEHACDIQKIFNIIDIWAGFEKKYGFSVRFSINRNDYSGIKDLGKTLGIDSAIEAVSMGVLLEDVLA